MIFADTSALYAVLDRDDANHPAASAAWKRLLESPDALLTHNYVLIEIAALTQHRLGLPALRALHEAIVPLLRVHWITQEEHGAAVQMALAAGRKKLSVVDCASFLVMRRLGIVQAFAFDRHFVEQGFSSV